MTACVYPGCIEQAPCPRGHVDVEPPVARANRLEAELAEAKNRGLKEFNAHQLTIGVCDQLRKSRIVEFEAENTRLNEHLVELLTTDWRGRLALAVKDCAAHLAENARLREMIYPGPRAVAESDIAFRAVVAGRIEAERYATAARSALQQAVEALEKGLDWAMCDHAQLCRHRGGVNVCNAGESGLLQCGLKSRVEKMRAAIATARKVLGA